jgi:hypothetical protein
LRGLGIRSVAARLTLAAALLFIWSVTYEYRGLVYDAQIYAVQALAQLRPSLGADLFLRNVSQDRFTIFPRVYAGFIEWIGLLPAALSLTILCSGWYLAAAWRLTKRLFEHDPAWPAVFLLLIIGCHYGAFGVFYVSEPFMTARLPAEALIVTALTCHFAGFERLGFLLAVGALCVHPLMALPGLLVLACLHLPRSTILVGAALGVAATFAAAIAAESLPAVARFLTLMDDSWVDVVRERSQFLFLQLWTRSDWAQNLLPFISLLLTVSILRDARTRSLAFAAIVVGAAGLCVAGIASLVGPVAILMQGQAWRWVWVTSFVAIVAILPTAYAAWREDGWGRPCAVLLITGWLLPVEAGVACVALALLLWTLRTRLPTRSDQHVAANHGRQLHFGRAAATALVVAVLAWSIVDSGSLVATSLASLSSPTSPSPVPPSLVASAVVAQSGIASIHSSPSDVPPSLALSSPFPSSLAPSSRVPSSTVPFSAPSSTVTLIAKALRAVFASKVWCVTLIGILWYLHRADESALIPLSLTLVLGALTAIVLVQSSSHMKPYGSAAEIAEFADWRRQIPPGSTVYVTNGYDSGSFVWFTLQRNNYLSSGQSAGVVFSRATALEVQRRSLVLLPLADPNWKMFTALREAASHVKPKGLQAFRPLTPGALISVCSDPQLGFVMSPDDVGFEPLRHAHAGAWHGWKLYDCDHVRGLSPRI